MTATSTSSVKTSQSRKERPNEVREGTTRRSRQYQQQPGVPLPSPAAGAHAASHLINWDATPGAGALPSRLHASGKEVDGGAG